MERNGVMVTTTKKITNTAERNDLVQDLNRLLRFEKGQQEDASAMSEMQLTLAMEALRAAIKYLDLVNDASNLGHYEMKQLNMNR